VLKRDVKLQLTCITAAITLLTGHTSTTSLASYQMMDTVQVGFPYLQSLIHRYSVISVSISTPPSLKERKRRVFI